MHCTDVFTLSHVAQVSSVCLHFHPWSSACALLFTSSLYFFLNSFFHLFLIPAMVPDENSMEDPLCNSSFGSMVSLDYVTPDTPTLLRHRTRTKMTLRSASCSPKHTENTPITAVWKVCLSVSRHCLSRPIERGNPWERATSISLVLVSETRTVLTVSFLQSPKLKNGR